MVSKQKNIHEDIKKDWRLSFYLMISGLLGLIALIFNFFPAFQVSESGTLIIIDNVSGWVAHFGGQSILIYVPNWYAIIAFIFLTLASISSLVFTLLLNLRRVEGHRRFSLVVLAIIFNVVGLFLLFSSVIPFGLINHLGESSYSAVYHFGLVTQSMGVLTGILMQWFFLIKIKHYIK